MLRKLEWHAKPKIKHDTICKDTRNCGWKTADLNSG